MKDENIKNRLWLERCRKDANARATQSATGQKQQHFAPNFDSLMRQVVTQDIQHRSKRFLDRNRPLLISMSQYISNDNETPLAIQLRRFRDLRPSKTSDNNLNFAPNRDHKVAAGAAMRRAMEVKQKQMEIDGEDFTTKGHQQHKGARCQTYALRPATAGAPQCTADVKNASGDSVSPQKAEGQGKTEGQKSAAQLAAADDTALSPPVAPLKPRMMRPSSADYGWMPRTLGLEAWQDPRFSHKLAPTDVTRDARIA